MKRTEQKIITLKYLLWSLLFMALGCHSANKKENKQTVAVTQRYTCPMHHEIIRDKPGNCPICGMDLVPFGGEEAAVTDVDLNTLLRPTNSHVLSMIPVITMQQSKEQVAVDALGTVMYDTRAIGSISSRVSGRIEKLYLKYTFQDVHKGQKVMDIYSPELLTAQQNLLFLLKNDAANTSFIYAAKEKLLLLGASPQQLYDIIQDEKPSLTISVYSNYNGHIHDALNMNVPVQMSAEPIATKELALKEGMYIQKGQGVLSVFDPHKLWAVLNIYADVQSLVKVGNRVHIIPETAPDKSFSAKIDFMEPFLRKDSKTATARVYFENTAANMPVGSQVKARITGNTINAFWLPKEAVISLGLDKVVFKKEGDVFKAHKVTTGLIFNNKVQIIEGLTPDAAVASNAQFLMDSESFIKIKE